MNLGYTGGNNLGIKYALQEEACNYLLILNDDIILTTNLMAELVDVMKKDPKIGITNPKILDFETKSELANQYGEYNFYLGVGHNSLRNKYKSEEIGLLRGTCFLLKKEVVEKIGLMDEDFFLYFDEADLSYRVKKAKYKMVFVPCAKVFHKVLQSFSGWANPVVLYYSTRNELLHARKHLNFPIFFLLWIPRFCFRIAYYFVRFRKAALVRAMLCGLHDFLKSKYGQTDTAII